MFKKIFLLGFALSLNVASANATPVEYNIDFGADGSGTFTVDSTSLDAIYASGLYFSPDYSVLSFFATVAGIDFDILGPYGIFAAADGQVSGITGLTTNSITSSSTPDVTLTINTCSGMPCSTYISGPGLFQELAYSVSLAGEVSVAEPAPLALLGLGLIGLGLARRRRSR